MLLVALQPDDLLGQVGRVGQVGPPGRRHHREHAPGPVVPAVVVAGVRAGAVRGRRGLGRADGGLDDVAADLRAAAGSRCPSP